MSASTLTRSNDAAASALPPFQARGAVARLMACRDREMLLAGPAGTGKSVGCLMKLHIAAHRYPGMRALMVRKTRQSLTQTAMVSFDKMIQPQRDGVRFHTGQQAYQYPNGSVIVVGGLDPNQITRVMSSEYDLIYVQEATELIEPAWEALTTRLRNGVMPYQQLIADCNPSRPTHWLKARADRGVVTMLESRHEDNPALHDGTDWTPAGREYIGTLDRLTGVYKQRLRYGRWAAADGLVYEGWDPAIHLISRFPIPREWPRYWAIDFGYTNPFVWQAWASDPDGRLYMYREIYQTRCLVEDHARAIARAIGGLEITGTTWRLNWSYESAEPRPVRIVCDHDAEGRATLEARLNIRTTPASKAVRDGIQLVTSRLQPAGDGKPRLYILDGSTVSRDTTLADKHFPTSTAEEFDGYVWDTSNGRGQKEEPVKEHDHGMDPLRYLVVSCDQPRRARGAA